ncbi:OmpW family protein [Acinetobacter haemolyticus]|uniref:OmpW family protein n=1 Tax=Acinetobacter haemolyticus TaxID=29430 RepID=A0AAJ3D8C5_ACIHA|nr:OmpW family outer membrane protein [Acinetobacter haemolyticus]NAR17913.1 OmpW family protein [Acinetobacter haemolyticus]NAR29852.1 OmpW family protein [Acinetobacter haemolyticus]NAR35911.1 OmpW family protein [Acinetobacter haemolyticus]NAR46745.1 OmpW family protein [Acinetobacter haemolyticus]NAR63183.1 OmpW family protein [Acinetobacter haemolyticus]
MMKKSCACLITGLCTLPTLTFADSPYFSLKDGDGFKRFSVSVGALYVKPTGKAQPIQVNTAIANGEQSKVGDVSIKTVKDSISKDMDPNLSTAFINFLDSLGQETLPSALSGNADIYGLHEWNNPGTGLEADDVMTLGIMTNYFFTDNVSFEVKAGIPPKVDIQGKGKIYAPLTATAHPSIELPIIGGIGLPEIDLEKQIFITDLEAHGTAATARAWTPAFEFQYHFGKTGVNKLRPYVGLGLMYAYFNELKINPTIEQDLINAGHKIVNIKEGKAGAALDHKISSGDPKVKLDASDTFAPVATAGFTYDFNDRWFAVGSVSYAHLTGEATITVNDSKHGELIRAKTDIEINPILGYAGIGYRF